MHFNKYLLSFFKLIIPILIFLNSCGIYKKADARKIPAAADERVAQNLEEGKGILTGRKFLGDGDTTFQFATPNELWRATLDVLDFLPLANVDYAGGIVITDWYSEGTSSEESIKITIRFLSNEVRADALAVLIHKRICKTTNNCNISKMSSATLEEEIKFSILRKATLLERYKLDTRKKNYKKKYGKKINRGIIDD